MHQHQTMTLRSAGYELFQAEINSEIKVADHNPLFGATTNRQIVEAFAGRQPTSENYRPAWSRALANIDFQKLIGDTVNA